MVEIELKSKELKEFVYLKLNKDRRLPIYDEDVERIKDVTLNALDFLDEPTDATIFDLIFFKNLKSCTIVNMDISENEIDVLNKQYNIKFIQFTNCVFPGNKKVTLDVEELVLDKCNNLSMNNFSEMNNLDELKIINCENIDLEGIEALESVKKLYLQNIIVDNINTVANLKNLEYVNLNGSEINNIPDEIKNNPKIKVVHEERNFMYDVEE